MPSPTKMPSRPSRGAGPGGRAGPDSRSPARSAGSSIVIGAVMPHSLGRARREPPPGPRLTGRRRGARSNRCTFWQPSLFAGDDDHHRPGASPGWPGCSSTTTRGSTMPPAGCPAPTSCSTSSARRSRGASERSSCTTGCWPNRASRGGGTRKRHERRAGSGARRDPPRYWATTTAGRSTRSAATGTATAATRSPGMATGSAICPSRSSRS